MDLPVTAILSQLNQALNDIGKAVLVAPPGAGKTTLVPLHLLKADWRKDGIIILLEPRRLAARAAANRMADLLGEKTGETVGYRMRMDSAVSTKTRILVVTEGVFARMIVDNPELPNIAAVIFDEYHERSLDADFGLALTLDIQAALRSDLRLLVMSATLDGARVAELLDNASVITSEGRAFPVDIRYQPRKPDQRIEEAMAHAIRTAISQEEGSILAFLPGQGEIERVKKQLEGQLPDHIILAPLYGTMDKTAQDQAVRPADNGMRKIVLATSIAESSLTIDGVRIVIDSGLSRAPVYDAASGIARLETVRSSRASIDQRAGRAGRTQAGIAIRLWHEGQNNALPAFATPEILAADLSTMVLECAAFGIHDPKTLKFLDPPTEISLKEAILLLQKLHALDGQGRLTKEGEAMRQMALPVHLSHMMIKAKEKGGEKTAAELAVLLSERGLGGYDIDLERRLHNFRRDSTPRAKQAHLLVQKIVRSNKDQDTPQIGTLLLHAYPDRIAKARGQKGKFVLANGRGAFIEETSPLAGHNYLVVADLTGKATEARILSAAEIDEETIRTALQNDIIQNNDYFFDPQSGALKGIAQEKLGAITLSTRNLPAPKGADADNALISAIRNYGLDLLPWNNESRQLRQRLQWLYRGLGEPWPDMSDENLIAKLETWLLPFLNGATRIHDIKAKTLMDALVSLVPFDRQNRIDKLAPTHFTVPTGSNIAICYEGDAPLLSVKVQELFGLATHPSIADGTIKLVLELLSPAHRPIQITRDLPAFWSGSWKDVRADMRGRYPKHPWPENPLEAQATRRAKPRGS